ncbi:osmoprotectant transport system permease protein [Barrientosiimonas humi]|uniref:Osmoprotectant transport system permease protein n=2 Tax=Barrientosiimonas TaxID=1535207 RepID=A0A542WZF1_9MICO|nr:MULTISPECIES: ABC transporter permease [Barrientosiimonas]TQL28950.1 osmoprotectant transport system permease protein [Barrientosiimonas humi]BDZ56410.1 putative osmoprotectant (glycine betaine/ carnitine/choline/l-proline) ABC transporter ProZ [Barrientosiimonas endolithica]CAG7571360.1 Glycine betaine/carnitine/choline transport system permease protein OpuCB [Barrientosiimonas humi]
MILSEVWTWLTSSENWSGDAGIANRLLEHLGYTGLTMLFAMLIALPLGTWIAHTGRGAWMITVANAARAIPSLGLLLVLVLWLQPKFQGDTNLGFLLPSIVALVVLALPPLLAGAYSGVSEVDPAARDAAKGMGMTGREVFFKVELPNALPLILSGVRSATLQVVATATIAAFTGLGGLGRYVIDGRQTSQSDEMIGGALLVAALALVLDLVLALVQRSIVSPGLTGRTSRRRLRPARSAADADTGSATPNATREQATA